MTRCRAIALFSSVLVLGTTSAPYAAAQTAAIEGAARTDRAGGGWCGGDGGCPAEAAVNKGGDDAFLL